MSKYLVYDELNGERADAREFEAMTPQHAAEQYSAAGSQNGGIVNGKTQVSEADFLLLDLDETRRRSQAAIDWDGGCALPYSVPPHVVIALLDNRARLLDEISELRKRLSQKAGDS